MFEKEAEDYSIDTYETCSYDNLPYVNDSRAREESFRDGANFGYKKARVEANEIIEGLMRFCRCFAQHHIEDNRYKEAEQFLRSSYV